MREGGKTSVYLGWPLWSEPMKPLVPLFPTIPFEWNGGVPALYGPDPAGTLLRQAVIAFVIFACVVSASALVRRWRAIHRSV